MAKLVAIYTRVSREDAEEPQSTRRQERACREYARSRNWDVAEVFEDVDVSAYDRRVRRPAFERLARAVAGGRVNGVVVWKLDRLVRRSVDFEHFWERCERMGIFLASVTEPLDSTNEIGLAVIRILVNFANVESTSISLRIRSKMKERARSGDPLFTGRAFGFTKGRLAVIEEEAVLIREAVERVLSGEQVASIVRDWNRRGAPTCGGADEWTHATLMQVLLNPRLAGDNTYNGEVVAKDCLPAVIDRSVHAELCAVLASRRGPARTPGRHLLSGLLRCQLCGSRLKAITVRRTNAAGERIEYRKYRCPSRPTGCGCTGIVGSFIEELIIDAVLYRIEHRDGTPWKAPAPNASERLSEAYNRYSTAVREAAYDYYVERNLTREAWIATREGIELQLNRARRELDPKCMRLLAAPRDTKGLRADWIRLDLAHQRDVIASELEYATVGPLANDQDYFDPSRVQPKWWQEDELSVKAPWPKANRDRVWSEHWMSTKETAAALGVSQDTVFRHIRKSHMQAVRFGHVLRLRRDYVLKLREQMLGTVNGQEAASQLGVSPNAISTWVNNGSLPAFRLGESCYIKREVLDRWAMELRRLISVYQAAHELGVPRGVIRQEIASGQLHALKAAKVTYLDRNELHAVLRDSKRGTSV